ncbi:MAG: DNA polymerase beta superfamily protein [Hyphomicrobiales bacterium]
MTIDELKESGSIVLECISGSRAYGLQTPTSDTDIKGVFILPKEEYYGLNYIPQVSNDTNDIVYYELNRFLELLMVNNPNIIELISTDKSHVLYSHPCMNIINIGDVLSKLCEKTFGNYAISQIKKARGLNKKIMNPMDKERKNILSFCFVNYHQGAMSLLDYLDEMGWRQEDCGLVRIPNMKDLYGLYHDSSYEYNGIMRQENSTEVTLSSVLSNAIPYCTMYFNKDGYSTYCKKYKEYWDWVELRNDDRYQSNIEHQKNYDSKNMMHVFRLLQMAIEIGRDQKVNVRRDDRDFLLKVKSGAFEYEELLELAEQKQEEMHQVYKVSSLPSMPSTDIINQWALQIREAFYCFGNL